MTASPANQVRPFAKTGFIPMTICQDRFIPMTI